MNTPLVSINIPVYKCENYIIRCLESVKAQTYQNIEIILINDCTPDNSISLIEKFIENNLNLNIRLLHHQENSGLSVVRNTGIDNSTGKYIYMLDSDDYITEDCIEKLVTNSEKFQCEISVAETICEYEDTKERFLYLKINHRKNILIGNDIIFERFAAFDWPIMGPNKLYLKSFITNNNLRFVKGLYSQDELWAFHCAEKLNSISFIKDITYIYYLNSASTVYNKTKINFENHQTIIEWFVKSYQATNDKKRRLLIRKKIIDFKKTTLQMQYKFMRDDVVYWKTNYNRLKKAPSLSISDYLNSDFTKEQKKENLLLNLPSSLGYKLFKHRYEK